MYSRAISAVAVARAGLTGLCACGAGQRNDVNQSVVGFVCGVVLTPGHVRTDAALRNASGEMPKTCLTAQRNGTGRHSRLPPRPDGPGPAGRGDVRRRHSSSVAPGSDRESGGRSGETVDTSRPDPRRTRSTTSSIERSRLKCWVMKSRQRRYVAMAGDGRALLGDQRVRDPDDQVLEKCGAQWLGVAGAPRRPGSAFRRCREVTFRRDFDVSCRVRVGVEPGASAPSPGEIDEVLLERIVTRRRDIMSDVRTVGKDRLPGLTSWECEPSRSEPRPRVTSSSE